jgi:hypothetical protein
MGISHEHCDNCQAGNCARSREEKHTTGVVEATVSWTLKAAEEIRKAGGDPERVLSTIPPALIDTFIRNNLFLAHRR